MLAAVVSGLVLAQSTAAAASVQLVANANPVGYGKRVRMTLVVTPATAGVRSEIRRADGLVVASGETRADGTFAALVRVRRPFAYLGRAWLGGGGNQATQSAPLPLRVGPVLGWRVFGTRAVGMRLRLSGWVLPADAGAVYVHMWGRTRRLAVRSSGVFRVSLYPGTAARFRAYFRVVPRSGYALARRQLALRIRRPPLGLGARGAAVGALERRLRALHYVVRGVGGSFSLSTYQAVVAFQKVHRMARTGYVGNAVWTALTRSRVPRARIPRGTHIEVDKTRQVMFEVVNGRVARVVHVSTGATGNTPVGSWRVYRLAPGGSLSGMYYSLYFLRGFAIHGYHSVPNYPASHGCVRTPLWFAPGFYRRWGRIGTTIVVFP